MLICQALLQIFTILFYFRYIPDYVSRDVLVHVVVYISVLYSSTCLILLLVISIKNLTASFLGTNLHSFQELCPQLI
jgi:hypothetical protein